MSKDEQEFIEHYQAMSPENKMHVLSLAHATRTAQEVTKKHYGIEDKAPEGRKTA